MNPGHWCQPQIIRPLAAVALAVTVLVPADAAAQRPPGGQAPCVSCLVIGVDAADLTPPPPATPGSRAGVQLMLSAAPRRDILSASGAAVGVLVTPSGAAVTP